MCISDALKKKRKRERKLFIICTSFPPTTTDTSTHLRAPPWLELTLRRVPASCTEWVSAEWMDGHGEGRAFREEWRDKAGRGGEMQDVIQMKRSSLYAGFFECCLRCLDIDPDQQAHFKFHSCFLCQMRVPESVIE